MTSPSTAYDNYALLQLCKYIGGEQPTIWTSETLSNRLPSDVVSLLSENTMLRSRLQAFLELDSEVWKLTKDFEDQPFHQFYQFRKRREFEKELEQKKLERSSALDSYEMLRRLVCYDLDALVVYPT